MSDHSHPRLKKLMKCVLESKTYLWLTQRRLFWVFAAVAYPSIRDILLWTGLMQHSGRQPFLIGRVKSAKSRDELKHFLETNGYSFDRLAWIDEGEILSMRNRVGRCQFHIRLFNDGEIRAHYEHAPEAVAFKHIFCPVVPRNKHFKELLKNFLEQ